MTTFKTAYHINNQFESNEFCCWFYKKTNALTCLNLKFCICNNVNVVYTTVHYHCAFYMHSRNKDETICLSQFTMKFKSYFFYSKIFLE